jgi:phosphoserine phosphatase
MAVTLNMDTKCKFYCYRKNRDIYTPGGNPTGTVELVIFDMDGVLANTISSWKYIHDYFGTTNERSVLNYLRGNIDDLEFIKRDVSLWKKNGRFATRNTIQTILSQIPLITGAKECITVLKNNHIKTAIVSAGLDILADRIAHQLGIDYVRANGIKSDTDGRVTGEGILRVQLKYKNEAIKELTGKIGVPFNRCIAVGNSCFDIPMFEICGLGIAFNPEDECVKKAADIVVHGEDLSKILPYLKPFFT